MLSCLNIIMRFDIILFIFCFVLFYIFLNIFMYVYFFI